MEPARAGVEALLVRSSVRTCECGHLIWKTSPIGCGSLESRSTWSRCLDGETTICKAISVELLI